MKHLTTVGYTQNTMKAIPRWCSDISQLDRIVNFQKKYRITSDRIFGKMDPRRAEFNLREIFPN